MRLNKQHIGKHPAESGYRVDFFVTDNDPNDFQDGSGTFFVTFPKIAVTGLEFRGKETLFQTGVLLKDLNLVENSVQLFCSFSGDVDGITGGAIKNIKTLGIYTGDNSGFQPDIIDFTNRVNEFHLDSDIDTFANVNITANELQNKYDENLFYKVIPLDYLTFGDASVAVSGEMFSGFLDPQINETEVVVSRENGKDLQFFQATEVIEIFTGTSIILKSGIPSDFYAEFRIKIDTEDVIISGSGLPLENTIDGFNVINNAVTVPSGNRLSQFAIDMLTDIDGNIESFLIEEA